MDVGTLRWFFFWCAIFNFFILGGFFLGFIFSGDMIYSFHRKWFTLDRDAFNTVMYFFLGIYKILILVFNFVPWLALLIAG